MKFKNFIFLIIFTLSIFVFIPLAKANPVPIGPSDYALNLLAFIPLLYLFTIAIEFGIFYIGLAGERSESKDLFKTIALMNLLTNPIAQIFGIFFLIILPQFLFYWIILIEAIVIIIESIFLWDKITLEANFYSTRSSSKLKLIGIVIFANLASLFAGSLPITGLFFYPVVMNVFLEAISLLVFSNIEFAVLYFFLGRKFERKKLYKSVILINILSFTVNFFALYVLYRGTNYIIRYGLMLLIPVAIEFYYFFTLMKNEEIIAEKDFNLKLLTFTGIFFANFIPMLFIEPQLHFLFMFPFNPLFELIIYQPYFNALFIPLTPLFILVIIAIEYVIFYLAFKRRSFYTKELFNKIGFINLLTSPLAILLMILFINYLVFPIILNIVLMIFLESIFLVETVNEVLVEEIPKNRSSKIKLISIVSVANTASMFLGFIPLFII